MARLLATDGTECEFGLGRALERLVPVPFRVVGDEPMLGLDEQKLSLRQLGVLSKAASLRPLGAVDTHRRATWGG